jgi:hypothetical protein
MSLLQKTIIKGLSKSSSKEPMPFDTLLKKCGVSQEALQSELDAMYQAKVINRCQHTKYGVTQMVYWPTAIIDKPINYHTLQRPLDKTLSPAPRRSEIEHLNASPVKETAMPNVADEANKPTCLRLLEYIEHHPNCPYSDFTDILKIDGASAFLGNHIKRGHVIKTQLGPRRFNYALIAGKTAKDIYNNGARTKIAASADVKLPKVEKQPTAVKHIDAYVPAEKLAADTQLSEQEAETFDIPAFLRKPASEQIHEEAFYEDAATQNTKTELETCVESLLQEVPEGCHITLRHPIHQNIQIEVDGPLLANPILVNLDRLSAVFGAINTIHQQQN